MLKRGGVLMLALLLALVLNTGASASPGDTGLFVREGGYYDESDTYLQDVVALGDTLYILGETGSPMASVVYTYKPGDAGPTEWLKGDGLSKDGEPMYNLRLFTDGEKLYALDGMSGTYYDLTDGTVTEAGRLDLSRVKQSEEDGLWNISSMAYADGALYMLYYDYMSAAGGQSLVRVPLDGSDSKAFSGGTDGELTSMTAYKDNTLLAIKYNYMSNSPEEATVLQVVDPASGAIIKTLPLYLKTYAFNMSMCYDPVGDKIYFSDGSGIMRYDDGELTVVNYLNHSSGDAAMMMFGTGHIALKAWNGLYIRNVDEMQLTGTPITISGAWFDDELIHAFEKEHPDIPLLVLSSGRSSQSMADDLRSGSAEVDIYGIYTGSLSSNTLMQGNYLQDLSSSQVLGDSVSRMYDYVQEILKYDGKLYGYPYSMNVSTWTVREDLMEQYDLAIPKTFGEYVDAYLQWMEQYGGEDPDIQYSRFWDSNGRSELFSTAISMYITAYETPDEPLKFDNPELKRILETILAMERNEEEELNSAMGRVVYMTGEEQIIIETDTYDPFGRHNYYDNEDARPKIIPPPSFDETSEPMAQGSLSMLCVNPNSGSLDSAMTFLEFLAKYEDAEYSYLLYPDKNEPLENSYYIQAIEKEKERLAELEERLTSADEESKQEIETEIGWTKENITYYENNRWEITQEAVDNYRQNIAPHVKFYTQSQFLNYENENAMKQISDILTRMQDGQLPVEQALKELESKAFMIFMEK